jgi:hypothetical protein
MEIDLLAGSAVTQNLDSIDCSATQPTGAMRSGRFLRRIRE